MTKGIKIFPDRPDKRFVIFMTLFLCFLSGEFLRADTSAQDWYNQSVEATKREAFDKSLIYIGKALKKEPQNDLYLAYQSHLFRLTGQFSKGQAAAEKAVALNDKVPWYHVSGALNSYYAGDWASTQRFLEKINTFSPDRIGEENLTMISWVKDQIRVRVYELSFQLNPKYGFRKKGLIYFSVPASWPPYQISEIDVEGVNIVRTDRTPGNHVCWVSDTHEGFKMKARIKVSPVSFRPQFSSINRKTTYPPEIIPYLKSSDRINTRSTLLLQTAAEIKGSIKDSKELASIDIQRISAIMTWLKDNMRYKIESFQTIDELITRGYAECGGYSALFVGLCRVMGIPAREVWGVIETSEEFAPKGFMKGHAWAEVFLNGIGWVPVDPQLPQTLGQLPPNYIRIAHYDRKSSLTDFKNYRPNGNLSRLMWREPWGDIVSFQRMQ